MNFDGVVDDEGDDVRSILANQGVLHDAGRNVFQVLLLGVVRPHAFALTGITGASEWRWSMTVTSVHLNLPV